MQMNVICGGASLGAILRAFAQCLWKFPQSFGACASFLPYSQRCSSGMDVAEEK
jgi:hypothetical protein